MNLSREQYGRIAQWIDGEDVALSDAERTAAEDIRRDERALKSVMAPDAPAAAMRLAADVLRAEIAAPSLPPRRRTLRFAYVAAAAAVAAAIVLAISLNWRPGFGGGAAGTTLEAELAVWYAPLNGGDVDIDLLALEADELEAEMLATIAAAPADMEFDSIQRALEEFWLSEPDLTLPET